MFRSAGRYNGLNASCERIGPGKMDMHGGRKVSGKGEDEAGRKAQDINRELRKLKERCASEGLGEEETLGRLLAHAEGELRAVPGLSASHRFSWVSGEVERRMLPREEV